MVFDYPLRTDERGRTAETSREDHVRDLIEQVLFTSPGERVNRSSFGTGLLGLVFGGNSPELATATQLLIQGALNQYLSDLIEVREVRVESQESTLRVEIAYVLRSNGQRRVAAFRREA